MAIVQSLLPCSANNNIIAFQLFQFLQVSVDKVLPAFLLHFLLHHQQSREYLYYRADKDQLSFAEVHHQSMMDN